MGNETLQKYEENILKIFGFWHIFVNNNWKEIVEIQKAKLKKSSLANNSEKIFIGTTGDVEDSLDGINYEVKCRENYILGELPIINYIHNFCSLENCLVWYIHTKGVTRPNNKCVSAWRNCLEYWIINKWKLCVDSLCDHDAAGALWDHDHFYGNFWWSNSNYVSKCKPINFNYSDKFRHQAEFFIGTANPIVKNLHEKKVDMYRVKYSSNRFMKIF